MAFVAPLATVLVAGVVGVAVPRLRWRRSLSALGLAREGAGIYRGRAICVARQGRHVTITIRTRNAARLYDELSSETPVPGLPWISELAAMQLSTLTFARRVWEQWRIRLHDQSLQISCATARPERLRFLLDLACDLAEGVDRFGDERLILRLRRRLS